MFIYIFDYIFDRHIIYSFFSNWQYANSMNEYHPLTMIMGWKDGSCLY